MAKKWFDSAQKRKPTAALNLVPISGPGEVEAADIEQLVIELETHRADATTAAFFATLGQLRPEVRLARNLKSLVRLLTDDDIQTVLRDGIDPGEREALCQLEVLGLATKEKLTAQRLLNIEERFQLHRVLADVFRRARTRRGGYLGNENV